MASVEQYKENIADKYIKDFKKELNFFEKIMLAPISNKMKEILKSDKKIDVNNLKDLEDLGFRWKVLWVKIWEKQLFEKLVNKTFNFLKEKQEKIIQAETQWRLDELSELVINWKLDNLEQRVNDGESPENGRNNNVWNGDNIWDSTDNTNEWNGTQWTNDDWEENWWWNEDESRWVNSVAAWAASWVWWAIVYSKTLNIAERKLWINKLEEAPEGFDAKRMKEMMQDIANQMNEKLNSPKLNKVQRKTYEKSVKNFKNAAESLDAETADAFQAWQKLQDRMPSTARKAMNYDKNTLRLIENLPEKELEDVTKLADEKAIIKFFDNKWIKVSEDLARQLKIAKNVSEIKSVTKILKNGTKLANVLKWIKWMGVVTILFAWFDVWCYLEWKKEAEMVSKINEIRWEILKDQATVQLLIWLWAVAVEALTILITCILGGSVAGPWWTVIWIAVWVIAAAASIWYDTLYADKKEFYAQNRYDFINQKRTKIKQSVVQLFESDRLDMNAGMKESIKDARWPNSEIDTMEDAWEALIYQEEIYNRWFYMLPMYYGSWESEETFKKDLSKEQIEEFEKEKEDMENIIETRKSYIKQYLDKNNPAYNQLKQAIESKKSLEFVDQILADSKVYAYIKSEDSEPYIQDYSKMSVQEYKEAYKKKLSNEYPTEFQIFEKLRQENPNHLQEICTWFMSSKSILESWFELGWEGESACYTEEQIPTMKKNIDFLSKYNEYRNLGVPLEKQVNSWIVWTSIDYKYIEEIVLDLNSVNKRPVWDKETSIQYLCRSEFIDRDNIESLVSDSVFQNIIYSIAREIHGYDWENNQFSLIQFYSGDWNDTWVYYDKKWEINIDWNVDRGFTEWDASTKEKLKSQILWKKYIWGLIINHYSQWAELDSPVEAADNQLNQEFAKRVEEIIDREYWYREKKSEYEKKIIDFIKTNNQWQDGYVEIPESLAIEAKKAGLWNVYKYLFRVEQGQIYALCRWDLIKNSLFFEKEWKNIKYEVTNSLRDANLLNIGNWEDIQYEATDLLREEYTKEEKALMKQVDDAEQKLQKLRDKQWGFRIFSQHQDDLDIPVELERIMSQKSIEWNQVKLSILYMEWQPAKDYLEKKSMEYYQFFNWMYLWILNQVAEMKTSNDMDNSWYFYGAAQFIWWSAVSLEGKDWQKRIVVNKSIHEAIRSHFWSLLDTVDKKSWKKISDLIKSDQKEEQNRWMNLANKILELCLEKSVLTLNKEWKVSSISQLDFSDANLQEVKKELDWVSDSENFFDAYETYKLASPVEVSGPATIRAVELAEIDSHKEIKKMTAEIIKTMDDVDRANKRKNPEFIADEEQNKEWVITWTFKSWWFAEKVTVTMDWDKKLKSIKIDKLNIGPFTPQEWFRIANLINWIKYNIKENPKWAPASDRIWWKYWKYQRSWNELERDITNSNMDVDILDNATVNKYYPSIKWNQEFLNYINSFL